MLELAQLTDGILAPVNWKQLREQLRKARDEEGLTLDELAASSGIDRSTIHRIENIKKRKDHNPDLETIEALIVKGMGRTLSSFFLQIEQSQNGVLISTEQPPQNPMSPSGEAVHDSHVPSSPVVIGTEDLRQIGRIIGRAIRDAARHRPTSTTRPREPKGRARSDRSS